PARAAEHGIFVAVTQLAGSEGGKLFPGGSLAVGPTGEVIARAPLFEEGTTLALLHAPAIERARAAAPLLADLEQALPWLERSLARARERTGAAPLETPPTREAAPDPAARPPATVSGRPVPGGEAAARARLEDLSLDLELVERALVEFLREEVRRRRGFERVVIGVSGGVDSAVSLFLACRALGSENVHAFRLPYRTSSPDSLAHAELAIRAVGAPERTIDISEPIDRYVECHEP